MGDFMAIKHCAACAQTFQPHPQTPNQTYCSAPECQKVRRRRWQTDKLQNDADYRDNQARAQRAWLDRNPGFWRAYRESHPEYVERNRTNQRERNASATSGAVAKMDASTPGFHLQSGVYRLSLASDREIAKMDVWTVEITVLDCQCSPTAAVAKRGRDRQT